jgi:hypothetical protein
MRYCLNRAPVFSWHALCSGASYRLIARQVGLSKKLTISSANSSLHSAFSEAHERFGQNLNSESRLDQTPDVARWQRLQPHFSQHGTLLQRRIKAGAAVTA